MSSNILVVESHADLRSVIAEALTRADYRCDAVASASDALLKLHDSNYSFILVDIDSPVSMSPLYEAIAAEPALRSRLVVISDEQRFAAIPEQPLLQKPFDTRALLAVVKDRPAAPLSK